MAKRLKRKARGIAARWYERYLILHYVAGVLWHRVKR